MRYWKGKAIEVLKENEVFVFGSNPEGRHGMGAAKAAMKFGAKYGVGRGLVGQTYALVTKNLKAGFKEAGTGVTYNTKGAKSVPLKGYYGIDHNIKELYEVAIANPDKNFLITYKNSSRNLNGYSPKEIIDVFRSLKVPSNIIFHESFKEINMIKTITIIGSRKTPQGVLDFMRKIAKYCAVNGIVVRSGKAGGADAAAIHGCMDALLVSGKTIAIPEMYIPWKGFGDNTMTTKWDNVQGENEKATYMAKAIHPAWDKCSEGAKKLHTRNVCQILGKNLDDPTDLVLYWCEERLGEPTGGTATAVNLGKDFGCVTINMLHDTWKDLLRPYLGMK